MSIEERVTRLERENRWWRRAVVVCFAIVAISVLTGQANQEQPVDLRVQSLSVVDDSGRTRASIRVDSEHICWFEMFSDNGNAGVSLNHHSKLGSLFALRNHRGHPVLSLANEIAGPGVVLGDASGTDRLTIGLDLEGAPAIALCDEKGQKRNLLRVDQVIPKKTGDGPERAKGNLLMFDAKGDVIWQAPR